jgi:hypothetical protein
MSRPTSAANGPKNKFDLFWKYCSPKLSQIYSIIIFLKSFIGDFFSFRVLTESIRGRVLTGSVRGRVFTESVRALQQHGHAHATHNLICLIEVTAWVGLIVSFSV